MSRHLERSATNRVISGVCGGVAEYLAIDPTLVRIFFVICTVLTAFVFILVYIALLILMPLPGERPLVDEWFGTRTAGDPAVAVGTDPAVTHPVAVNGDADRRRNTIGYALIAIGAVFLLSNVGVFRFVQWQYVWPLALVALGVLLLIQRTRS